MSTMPENYRYARHVARASASGMPVLVRTSALDTQGVTLISRSGEEQQREIIGRWPRWNLFSHGVPGRVLLERVTNNRASERTFNSLSLSPPFESRARSFDNTTPIFSLKGNGLRGREDTRQPDETAGNQAKE